VVEANFFTRFGLVSFLRGQRGLTVVAAAPDGEGAVRLFDRVRPHVTIVDLQLPRLGAPSLICLLSRRRPARPVLVLSQHHGEEDTFRALRSGAAGYLSKEGSGEDLVAAIRVVAGGGRFFPAPVLARIAARMARPELTGREREVLRGMADGSSNREIAGSLGISERTVEVHASNLLAKLEARSRVGAVAEARKRGLMRWSGD
jgi:DNA-binding NarL/FixJ family response regulator